MGGWWWWGAGTVTAADLMGLGWDAAGRPTAAPPGAVGPFGHEAAGGLAEAGCTPPPPGRSGQLLQGQKGEGGQGRWGRMDGQSVPERTGLMGHVGDRGLPELLLWRRLWDRVVFGPRGKREADAAAEHVLVVHAPAGTLRRLLAAEAEHGRALGHAQHLAAAVV